MFDYLMNTNKNIFFGEWMLCYVYFLSSLYNCHPLLQICLMWLSMKVLKQVFSIFCWTRKKELLGIRVRERNCGKREEKTGMLFI